MHALPAKVILMLLFCSLFVVSCGGGNPQPTAGSSTSPTAGSSSTTPSSGNDMNSGPSTATTASSGAGSAAVSAARVLRTIPHDPSAFTQGLILYGGSLYESTGGYGNSTIRQITVESGETTVRSELPANFFGEGITILGDTLYQLTWWENTCIMYDQATLQMKDNFRYEGEGWGITNDGTSLIMSNGTSSLRFINPATFGETRSIQVTDGDNPVSSLNELEWVQGEIWANVWPTLRIARIDPETGRVRGWLDLSNVAPAVSRENSEAVLNGIAADPGGGSVFVTGKMWPAIYQISLP